MHLLFPIRSCRSDLQVATPKNQITSNERSPVATPLPREGEYCEYHQSALYYPHRPEHARESVACTLDTCVYTFCHNLVTRASRITKLFLRNGLTTMLKIEGLMFIFIVVMLVGLSVFWTNAIRNGDVTPTLERLIEAGYTIEEILQHPDIARINRMNPRLFPNLDDWTDDDLQRARNHIKTLPPARAATNVLIDACGRLIDRSNKRIAVNSVIIAAQETHMKGPEPFTIKNSLPASVRAEVDEAFGEDAESVLTQIEEAFSTQESAARVFESEGGVKGFVNRLAESQSAAADK